MQLHAGFQFQAAPSTSVKQRAHAAIDAGADMVIAHHPHVLQGFEWYKVKLIAYSLGNFIFDQDFLSTFSSGYLRTVWEGTSLVEARFVPTVISGYEPTPVTDGAGGRVLDEIWAKSRLPAAALRDKQGQVKVVLQAPDPNAVPADLIYEQGSARIVAPAPARPMSLALQPGTTQTLPPGHLFQSHLGRSGAAPQTVLVGRDLFGWGSFEDETADDSRSGNMHWHLNPKNAEISWDGPKYGQRFLRIKKWSGSDGEIMVRPVARVPLAERRFSRAQGEGHTPADPLPAFSIQLATTKDKPTPCPWWWTFITLTIPTPPKTPSPPN